jgi:intracellular sulfur oxidation DsrE/DsrF family protein
MALISKSNADAKLEAVIYGQGLDIVLKGKTAQEPALAQLMANKNVTFKVCEATMKRNNIDRSQLIPGVEVVPDGIYEIITKQKEGWGYIKVAH